MLLLLLVLWKEEEKNRESLSLLTAVKSFDKEDLFGLSCQCEASW